jgi:copper chaperone CopZ
MRLLFLVSMLSLGTLLHAGDVVQTKYTAVLTGIVCQSCKATVTAAMKKLPGVGEVDFAKGEKPGAQKVTFSASSSTLTKNDAELALGEHLKEFAVLSFEPSK